ncbi:hypothetical protein PoB_005824200 [Plakobranchus ocellatus]|uniref:MADF domain-containing protein n=1 Tax=Plakobranchus ocellatus TaxID=259542 RepID=A0AAV4CJ78_9GAST|nr:hypothetical protein PoB_005824200 [Plakobranchus ocellatus]
MRRLAARMPRGKGLVRLKDYGATEALIELVRKYKMIYAPKSAYYRDSRAVAEAWAQITKAMQLPGLTTNEVKVRWRTLRDSYIKKKKELAKISAGDEGNTATVRWKYMSLLGFLDPYILDGSNNRTDGALSSEEEKNLHEMFEMNRFPSKVEPEDASSSASSVHLDLSSIPGDSSYFSNFDKHPQQERKKSCIDTDIELKKSLAELVKVQSRLLEEQCKKENQCCPIMTFFQSCALRAKSLSKAKQGWLQVEVSKLLYDAECSDSGGSTVAVPGSQQGLPLLHALSQPTSSAVAARLENSDAHNYSTEGENGNNCIEHRMTCKALPNHLQNHGSSDSGGGQITHRVQRLPTR